MSNPIHNDKATGNSNWQGDAHLIWLMRKLDPESVLDLGVGKWAKMGYLLRKNVEDFNAIITGKRKEIKIVGVEGAPENFMFLKKNFPWVYDELHFMNISPVVTGILKPNIYDVIIFGDVLEHFGNDHALELLKICVKNANKGVIIQIPLGSYLQEVDINPLENHRSTWVEDDLQLLGVKWLERFLDLNGRSFAVCLLDKDGNLN